MAKKNKEDRRDKIIEESLDVLRTDQYGLSGEFIRKNEEQISQVKDLLMEKLSISQSNNVDKKSETNISKELINVIYNTLDRPKPDQYKESVDETMRKIDESISGSYGVKEDSSSDSDLSIIESLGDAMKTHFRVMPEYRKMVEIIPELGKCVDMVTNDLLNVDEFTHTFISNVYKDEDEAVQTTINKKIIDLLKEYNFESLISRWLPVAEVSGVKPFAILPQEDIISDIAEYVKKKREKDTEFSFESLSDNDLKDIVYSTESDLFEPSPIAKEADILDKYNKNILSFESDDDTIAYEMAKDKVDDYVSGIIDGELLSEYKSIVLDDVKEAYVEEKYTNLHDDDRDVVSLESAYDKFNDILKSSSDDSINKAAKTGLKELILGLESTISVVNKRKGHIYQTSKKVKSSIYSSPSNNKDEFIDDDFFTPGKVKKKKKKGKKDKREKSTIIINGYTYDVDTGEIDPKEYSEKVPNKRAVIVDFNPEHVIPVTLNGNHIGYYVIEYTRLANSGLIDGTRPKQDTFIDMVKRLGVGDDKTTVKGAAKNTDSVNATMYTGLNAIFGDSHRIVGKASENDSGKNSKVTDFLKKVMIRTISRRLGDDALLEDATFQSGVMNILRDDLILKQGIRFTYIPLSHMVYMSRELDEKGFPVSMFDGTLFLGYIYISSLISSLMMKVMKSADTEVMDVNVGKAKALGSTVSNVIKQASTRNVSAVGIFSGVENIVRQVGSYKKIVNPVVNGEKLFDISSLEKNNDTDIDDDFTERILKSIIIKTIVPLSALNLTDEDEYAISVAQQRIDYRNAIIDKGMNYAPAITKAIKLLVNYSDIGVTVPGDNGDKEEYEIKIDNVEFNFNPPKNLTVNKLSEEIDNISDLAEKIVKVYLGEDDRDGDEWPVLKQVFTKLIVKELSSSMDWSTIDELLDTAKTLAPGELAKMKKYDKEVAEPESDDEGSDDSGDRW